MKILWWLLQLKPTKWIFSWGLKPLWLKRFNLKIGIIFDWIELFLVCLCSRQQERKGRDLAGRRNASLTNKPASWPSQPSAKKASRLRQPGGQVSLMAKPASRPSRPGGQGSLASKPVSRFNVKWISLQQFQEKLRIMLPTGQILCNDYHCNRYQKSAKMIKKLMPNNKSILRTAFASMLAVKNLTS